MSKMSKMSKMFENEYIDKHKCVPWETTTTELRSIISEHGRLPVSCSNVVLSKEPLVEHHLTEYETKAFADVGALFLFEQITTIGCHPDVLGMNRNDTLTLCIAFGYEPRPRTCVSMYNHILTPKVGGLYAAKLGYFDQGSVNQINDMDKSDLITFENEMRIHSTSKSLATWLEFRDVLPVAISHKVLRYTTGMVCGGREIGGYDVRCLLDLDTNILEHDVYCQFTDDNGGIHLMDVIRTDDSVPTLQDFKTILEHPSLLKYSNKFNTTTVSEFADILYRDALINGDTHYVYKYCDFLPDSDLGEREYTDHISNLIHTNGLGDNYILTDMDKLIIANADKKKYSSSRIVFRLNMVKWYDYTWTTTMVLYNLSRITGCELTTKSVRIINAIIDDDANTFGEIDKFLLKHPELTLIDVMDVSQEPTFDTKVDAVRRMLDKFPEESTTATTVWPGVVDFLKKDKIELSMDPIFNKVWRNQITDTAPFATSFYGAYQPWQRSGFLPNTLEEIVTAINQTPIALWGWTNGWIYDSIRNLPKSTENALRRINDGLTINGKYLLDKAISKQTEFSMDDESIFSQWIELGDKIDLLENHKQLPEILKRYL